MPYIVDQYSLNKLPFILTPAKDGSYEKQPPARTVYYILRMKAVNDLMKKLPDGHVFERYPRSLLKENPDMILERHSYLNEIGSLSLMEIAIRPIWDGEGYEFSAYYE